MAPEIGLRVFLTPPGIIAYIVAMNYFRERAPRLDDFMTAISIGTVIMLALIFVFEPLFRMRTVTGLAMAIAMFISDNTLSYLAAFMLLLGMVGVEIAVVVGSLPLLGSLLSANISNHSNLTFELIEVVIEIIIVYVCAELIQSLSVWWAVNRLRRSE